MNKVILVGKVGQDPELKYSANGLQILQFSLATNEYYKDQSGERKQRTDWHRVKMFGPRAETLNKYIQKGTNLLVEGQVRYSQFEKDGQKVKLTEINARDIELLARSNGQSQKLDESFQSSIDNLASQTSQNSASRKNHSASGDSFGVPTITADDIPF